MVELRQTTIFQALVKKN